MKRLLLAALVIATSAAMVSLPAQAQQDQQISRSDRLSLPTSNALPLLETDPIRGRIANIEGNRVQVLLANGESQTYRISASKQQRYSLQVGSEVTLHVRRLNNAVIAISEADSIAQEQPY